jgi:predicted nucleic acid-binding protein
MPTSPESRGPVVLDTDVASLIQRRRLDTAAAGLDGRTWCVTFVTVGELAQGATTAGWGLRKWTALAEWLRHVVIVPADGRVAYTWGLITGKARARGRPRPVNDSWIAATCLTFDLPLATRNRRDFEDFSVHEGLQLAATDG